MNTQPSSSCHMRLWFVATYGAIEMCFDWFTGNGIPGILHTANQHHPAWSVPSAIRHVWPTQLYSHVDWLWEAKFCCQWTSCLEQLTYWTSVTWHLAGRFQGQTENILCLTAHLAHLVYFIPIFRSTNVLNNNNNGTGIMLLPGGSILQRGRGPGRGLFHLFWSNGILSIAYFFMWQNNANLVLVPSHIYPPYPTKIIRHSS